MARKNISTELVEIFQHQILSGQLKANEPLDAISKLAKQYRTTIATISKVLAHLEQAGYVERFQGKGVFVKEKTNCRIALVLDSGAFAQNSANVSFIPILLNELEKKSQEENWTYELFLGVDSNSSAQNFLLKLVQNAFDVVLIGSRWLAKNSEDIFKNQFVFAIGIYPYKDLDFSISFDFCKMVYDAVLELDQQGCQQIALVENDKDQSWSKDPDCHIRAYHDALKSIGKMRNDQLHFKVPVSQKGGYDAFCELVKNTTTRPLGIISVDSLITLGIVQAALSKDLNSRENVIIATQTNQGCGVAQITIPVIKFECSLITYLEHIAQFIKRYNQGCKNPVGIDLIAPEKKNVWNNRCIRKKIVADRVK